MSAGHTPGQSEVQPESLRIAKALDEDQWRLDDLDIEAADELRRLHAINVELLEALQKLLEANSYYFPEGNPWGDRARAAIAKATGATP